MQLAVICLAEFPSIISKLEPGVEDLLFGFLEKALENPHVKVKQAALHILVVSFRLAGSQPAIKLKLASFVAQLKPSVRHEVEKKLGSYPLFFSFLFSFLSFFAKPFLISITRVLGRGAAI